MGEAKVVSQTTTLPSTATQQIPHASHDHGGGWGIISEYLEGGRARVVKRRHICQGGVKNLENNRIFNLVVRNWPMHVT